MASTNRNSNRDRRRHSPFFYILMIFVAIKISSSIAGGWMIWVAIGLYFASEGNRSSYEEEGEMETPRPSERRRRQPRKIEAPRTKPVEEYFPNEEKLPDFSHKSKPDELDDLIAEKHKEKEKGWW